MFNKKNVVALLTGMLVCLGIFIIKDVTILFDGLEKNLQRFLFYYREPRYSDTERYVNPYVHEDVHIVGIDEKSLAIIGKWPWPRDVHADLIKNLEQFSPESIFIDVLFIDPERLPPSVAKRIVSRPEIRTTLNALYRQSDQRFANEVKQHHNIYIDQKLQLQRQAGLPTQYEKRIQHNENILLNYSTPGQPYDFPIFKGLEPIITPLVDYAKPTIINAWPDRDNVLRSFNLLHTYQRTNEQVINIHSAVLSLLMQYYKVHPKDIVVHPNNIVLKNATVPQMDPKTKKKIMTIVPTKKLTSKIKKTTPPEDYPYNKDLYTYLINYAKIHALLEDDLIYEYPITLDNHYNLVDGFEIYDALLRSGVKKVNVLQSQMRDFVIHTRKNDRNILHTFLINYAGKQEQYYTDSFDKTRRLIHNAMMTSSYYKASEPPPLPALPRILNDAGKVSNDHDMKALSEWFVRYTGSKIREIENKTLEQYGSKSDEEMIEYALNQDPFLGKFLFYEIYLQNGGDPLDAAFYKDFMQILKEEGLDVPSEIIPPLSPEQLVLTLQEAYGEGFSLFYKKLLMIGMRTIGVAHDIHETPYGTMYGINTIANAFSTIATHNLLKTSSFGYNLIFLIIFCLIAAVIHRFLNTWVNFVFFLFCLIGTFIYAYIAFSVKNTLVETTPLIFANVFILILTILYRITTEEKDRKFLKSTFSSYLSPELIDEMFHTKTMPTLGGEARKVTAFFTDIQGFSTFSEKLTAQQLVELLNEYLAEMTQILTDEKGTLDKYEGDAIIAFIGAPMDIPSHAYNACKIAIRMQHKLLDLRTKWQGETYSSNIEKRNTKNIPLEEWAPNEKWPKIVHNMRMRIGINTGEIVVGNMGSQLRMNYTMMGDAVNLAARLEAAAKQYGMFTLVSEVSLQESFVDEEDQTIIVKDLVECRFIDKIIVMGRSEPVAVYELITLKGDLTKNDTKLIASFKEGMACYLNMQWDQAMDHFKEADQYERFKDSKLTPSQLFINRCKTLKVTPPVQAGETWDGVWTLTEK